MVLESHARKREAEDTGGDIAEGTETSSEKGMCSPGTAMNLGSDHETPMTKPF